MTQTELPAVPPALAARGVSLRHAEAGDDDFLRDVYVTYRWQEMEASGWPAETRLAFLHDQHRLQHLHYRKYYEGAAWGIIEVGGERAGRLYLLFAPGDFRVVDIALMPRYRDGGLGGGLLAAVQQQAQALGAAKVSIHVEQSNPALRLYERLGFRRIEERGPYFLLEWPVPAAGPMAPNQPKTA